MSGPLLLLGGSGQVGTDLRALARQQEIELVAPGRNELDLADRAAVRRVVAEASWGTVINAAAYTDVDRAESERPVAFAINGEAPARLAAETGRRGIPLIHISTDYVFDGRKGAPYVESDNPAPLNVYGSSKLAGEAGVRSENPRHVIVRTAWVYSPFGRNFVKTILRLAVERDRVEIVTEQRGNPTAARDVASACLDIARQCAAAPERVRYGLYHFAGAGEANRFEYAQAVVASAAHRLGRTADVVMSRAAQPPAPAVRPADTRLDSAAVMREFGVKARPWREAVRETVECLLAGKGGQ